jgi:hypothetical protein
VLSAVELDGDSGLGAIEVEDETVDGMLSATLRSEL